MVLPPKVEARPFGCDTHCHCEGRSNLASGFQGQRDCFASAARNDTFYCGSPYVTTRTGRLAAFQSPVSEAKKYLPLLIWSSESYMMNRRG